MNFEHYGFIITPTVCSVWVGRLNGSLAFQSIKDMEETKCKFVLTVTHELRLPVEVSITRDIVTR